jgi:hypothetical protein
MPKCKYCGSTWHVENEHVKARSKGGRKTVKACRGCNRSKSNKGLMEWLRWLKINDSYRWRRIRKYNKGKKNQIAKKVHNVGHKR